ncbi:MULTISPECIES: hypothetical protein [unclassified Ruegeria]|uniref:hypothetical protein n=1 Tax=unclassified Ruegeria TaxID=2625375 RepID=UPI0014913977|nr:MULTISPECIES: hypothetical protein [unclassified Ruegeria]NOD36654.1 hypothetical protein [Ruegeria sp. HKCCD7296]NOE43847.1 hypothetical protein [Ruegeria sp. HKCCD7319]
MDGQVPNVEHFGEVYVALLQAQKWRYDKDALSVDPPHAQEWDEMDTLLRACSSNLDLAAQYLSDQGLLPLALASEETGYAFHRIVVLSLLGRATGEVSLPQNEALIKGTTFDFVQALRDQFPEIMELGCLETLSSEEDVLSAFGFYLTPTKVKLSELSPVRSTSRTLTTKFEELSIERFLLVRDVGLARTVVANKNNRFVRELLSLDPTQRLATEFFNAYADAMEAMPTEEQKLAVFSSYLAMSLDQHFRDNNA